MMKNSVINFAQSNKKNQEETIHPMSNQRTKDPADIINNLLPNANYLGINNTTYDPINTNLEVKDTDTKLINKKNAYFADKAKTIMYNKNNQEISLNRYPLTSNRSNTQFISGQGNSLANNSEDKMLSRAYSIEDNEEEIDENKTFRTQLDLFYNEGNKRKIIEITSVFLAFTTFIIFIVSTYFPEGLDWFNIFDTLCCSFFILEIVLHFFLAQHRMLFLLDLMNLADIFTCVVPLLSSTSNSTIKKIVEAARSFRVLKVSKFLNKNIKLNRNEVAKQVGIMILYILTQILIFTLLFRIIENDYILFYTNLGSQQLRDRSAFHEILYFTVVTISTVGFGDIYPVTELGRILCTGLVVLNFYLIPKQTNELIKYMSTSSVYSREVYKSNVEIPHLVICGNVSVDSLTNFCQELFHVDHGLQDRNAVIIQQSLPSQDMKIFLHSGVYEVSLKYLQGNPIFEKDLERADLKTAVACVIMTDKYTDEPHPVDHKNILMSLYIKKYLLNNNTNKQLFIQLIKPENKIHYQQGILSIMPNQVDSDQIIIVEEIKMNLLSKSCLIPGIITMISNLVISAGGREDEADEETSPWQKEYSDGRGHEIYRTPLNEYLKDKSFTQISSLIYKQYNAIVFALEIQVEDQTIIRLNPGNFYIDKIVGDRDDVQVFIYIICSDRECADKIENYGKSIGKVDEVKKVKNLSKFDLMFKLNKTDIRQLEEGMDPNNELVEEEDDYFIEKQIIHNNVDVKKDSIRNSDKITKHIVVCGTHPSLYYFILPLRAKYLGEENQKKIVILANDIKKELWDSISRFKDITLINGSPLNTYDLLRANIEYADKAVILDCDNIKSDNAFRNEMADSESIFVYKAIKKCNKNIQIMTELIYASNIEFLLPKNELSLFKKNKMQYETTSLFAGGEVYISSIIDTLTCQAYYNPHIVTVLHQLLTGGKNNINAGIRGICENVGLKQSNLWQIPIPEEFINKEFVELYTYLAEEANMIAIGLYRLAGAQDNESPYVYTNPERDTRLSHRDRVFVLAIDNINSFLKKHNLKNTSNKINNDYVLNQDEVEHLEENKIVNKSTPFKFLDDNINDIKTSIEYIESMFKALKETVHETISNAVKQEISSLLQ